MKLTHCPQKEFFREKEEDRMRRNIERFNVSCNDVKGKKKKFAMGADFHDLEGMLWKR